MIKGSEERLLLQMRLNMNEAPLNSAIVPIYTAEPYQDRRVKHCGPDLKEFRNHIGRRRLTGQLPGHVRRLGRERQPYSRDS